MYISSLELGPSAIQDIAKKSQISRSTVYEIIPSLINKGLMSTVTEGKKIYYVPEKPERLLSLLEIKQKELEGRKKELKAIIPELHDLIKLSRSHPKIKLYKGKQGIRMIQEDIIKSKEIESIEEFIPIDNAYQLFPPHARDHRHKMAKIIEVPERVIYTSTKGTILPSKRGLIERCFIPNKDFPFQTEITIYADKVAVVSFKERLIGILIQSEDIAHTLRSMFNLLWKMLNKNP